MIEGMGWVLDSILATPLEATPTDFPFPEQDPRNVAELLADKRNLVGEWCKSTFEGNITQLTSGIGDFALRVEEMRRRILGLRDLLKGELVTQHGDAVLSNLRTEMMMIQNNASEIIKLSPGDQNLIDQLATCDDQMKALEKRMRTAKTTLAMQMFKFDQCFRALDGFMATIRAVLDSQIRKQPSELITFVPLLFLGTPARTTAIHC